MINALIFIVEDENEGIYYPYPIVWVVGNLLRYLVAFKQGICELDSLADMAVDMVVI